MTSGGTAMNIKLSQFNGCLLGGLIGDCLSFPYVTKDHNFTNKNGHIQQYFYQLHTQIPRGKIIEIKQYTAQSSMTHTLANYLLRETQFDGGRLAKEFTTAYLQERKNRFYDDGLIQIFLKLSQKESFDLNDLIPLPINPSISWVTPLALMSIQDDDISNVLQATIKTCQIFYGEPMTLIGAILQILCIRLALLEGAQRTKKRAGVSLIILNSLEDSFNRIFPKLLLTCKPHDVNHFENCFLVYQKYLQNLRQLLLGKFDLDQIQRKLSRDKTGNVSAVIYSFLASFSLSKDQFERTLHLAMTLGGTDVACAAGALAGAYLGEGEISQVLGRQCEDCIQFHFLGRKLFEKLVNSSSPLKFPENSPPAPLETANSPVTSRSTEWSEVSMDLNGVVENIKMTVENSLEASQMEVKSARNLTNGVVICTQILKGAEEALREVNDFRGLSEYKHSHEFLMRFKENLEQFEGNELIENLIENLKNVLSFYQQTSSILI